jgi:hypothetical protein
MPYFIPPAVLPGPRPFKVVLFLLLLSLRSFYFEHCQIRRPFHADISFNRIHNPGERLPKLDSVDNAGLRQLLSFYFGGNCRAYGLYIRYNPPPSSNGAIAQTFAGYQATSDVHHAALFFSVNLSGCGPQAGIPRFPEAPPVSIQSRWWQAIAPRRPGLPAWPALSTRQPRRP